LKQLDPEVRDKYNKGVCEEFYDLGKVIGKGGFATVRHGTLLAVREFLALILCCTCVSVDKSVILEQGNHYAPALSLQRELRNSGSVAAKDNKTQEEYAIKIMEVAPAGQDVGGNDNTWADVIAEVSILCRLDHPNIISLREFFIQSNKVYLVTNLVKGASLRIPNSNVNSCAPVGTGDGLLCTQDRRVKSLYHPTSNTSR
jgi:serine/threonine protein kinase